MTTIKQTVRLECFGRECELKIDCETLKEVWEVWKKQNPGDEETVVDAVVKEKVQDAVREKLVEAFSNAFSASEAEIKQAFYSRHMIERVINPVDGKISMPARKSYCGKSFRKLVSKNPPFNPDGLNSKGKELYKGWKNDSIAIQAKIHGSIPPENRFIVAINLSSPKEADMAADLCGVRPENIIPVKRYASIRGDEMLKTEDPKSIIVVGHYNRGGVNERDEGGAIAGHSVSSLGSSLKEYMPSGSSLTLFSCTSSRLLPSLQDYFDDGVEFFGVEEGLQVSPYCQKHSENVYSDPGFFYVGEELKSANAVFDERHDIFKADNLRSMSGSHSTDFMDLSDPV